MADQDSTKPAALLLQSLERGLPKYSSFGGDADSSDILKFNRTESLVDNKFLPISFAADLDTQIKKLKRAFDDWREIILPINSVLLWEKQWYPAAIIGGNTILFFSLWLFDASLLSTLALLGLFATLCDYLVPSITSSFFRADSWTTLKQNEFENVCRALVVFKEKIAVSCASFYLMRTIRPKIFYSITIISLSSLIWIGNTFNNLFLTYILVTFLCLMPGMESQGIFHTYGSIATQKISDFLNASKLLSGGSHKKED